MCWMVHRALSWASPGAGVLSVVGASCTPRVCKERGGGRNRGCCTARSCLDGAPAHFGQEAGVGLTQVGGHSPGCAGRPCQHRPPTAVHPISCSCIPADPQASPSSSNPLPERGSRPGQVPLGSRPGPHPALHSHPPGHRASSDQRFLLSH